MTAYADFIKSKSHSVSEGGFAATFIPDLAKDFQAHLIEFAVRLGRSAIFADCGLGKTPIELAVAENFARRTEKPVLILTPLAVGPQFVSEGEKFGVEATRSLNGQVHRITIANYERLHYFNPADFCGVVLDESSILKAFDGTRRLQITEFMKRVQYRANFTATAAPNDHIEFGTQSEALGLMGYMDMLHRFFRNDQGKGSAAGRSFGRSVDWKLRQYAETAFWEWLCSWAKAVRMPSDLGFSDEGYTLPDLLTEEILVAARSLPQDALFETEATDLRAQQEETRRTVEERCECAAERVAHGEPAIVWCQRNDEGELLEHLIPDAVQVSGSDSDEEKEAKMLAFTNGNARVMITKPKIGAWGLNWQHCAHMTVFPSHSFEQYYQSVRRCYRFGQTKQVRVDMITTHGGKGTLSNLRTKQAKADEAFRQLVAYMNRGQAVPQVMADRTLSVPSWLSSAK